ncbi:unnamed protein product [Xylocopa violacea]|uniref:Uncharacterized protein n=1 Tax=Xylocopa violacea TaxID=135666 RepID=A0ABP1NHK7_XYLVO
MAPRIRKAGKTGSVSKGREKGAESSRAAPGRVRRVDRSRIKGRKTRRKLKLKGWLATPNDWARFNAWAKKNALPKKIPEPEPIVGIEGGDVRPSKPLRRLRKRLKVLSRPRIAPDPSVNCKLDLTISKAALTATPSRRTILLALPNIRLCDFGRVYYKVSPAALNYQPSERILELSQPRGIFLPEECRPPRISMCEKRGLDEERLRKLALAKKLIDCPQQLTKEEMEELFTPSGIRRTALTYEITPWMSFLALPPYKKIKEREDENAITWKKKLIEEGELRGKCALAEHKEKIEGVKMAKKRKCEKVKRKKGGDSGDEVEGEEEEEEEEDEDEEELTEEERQQVKRRRIEKHAWRFAPKPCKDDPFRIKRATLKAKGLQAKASSRTKELSKPRTHESKSIRANPFTVKKSALSASASGRTESLAKPSKPRALVERKPPREKDKYGRPIFEMPVYGKVLPKTKPYKMGECPVPEEKKIIKKRPIDPIVYEQTYDPCIYPDWAKRQKMERKRAEKLLSKKKIRRGKRRKKLKKSRVAEVKKDEEEKERVDVTTDQPEEEKERVDIITDQPEEEQEE